MISSITIPSSNNAAPVMVSGFCGPAIHTNVFSATLVGEPATSFLPVVPCHSEPQKLEGEPPHSGAPPSVKLYRYGVERFLFST